MPDLNPAYEQQGGTPLPLAFGYVQGSGNPQLPYVDTAGNTYLFSLLFDGECDGVEMYALTTKDHLWIPGVGIGGVVERLNKANQIHWHAGRWTPIGAPQVALSKGPDQCTDQWFAQIPTVTPPQSFSNIAYAVTQIPNLGSILDRVNATPPDEVNFFGVFRGARCRYFDSSGNVTGYGFTTNPTWHMVEAILRYKFKRQQPQIAGLTNAEKGIFNWPAIVAHAARNDYVLANGWPRFMGNYVFPAQATLSSLLETMLRSCRSYIDDPGGKIGFYGYDATNSGFLLTANHIEPGSFKAAQRDLTRAPNVFIPKFRDLNLAALVAVTSASVNNSGASAGSVSIPSGAWALYLLTNNVNPFVASDVMTYGDCSNPALNGDYIVAVTPDPSVAIPGIWCDTQATSAASGTGGYVGTQDSRFAQRAPTTVQHSRHQKSVGAPAPGVAALPNIVPVDYDLGNMTYDQANRLMQYECNSLLGIDQAGWKAPISGTVRVRLDAVDAAGNVFALMRPNEGDRGDGCGFGRFTVDPSISVEMAGEYIIKKMKITPAAKGKPGYIDISFVSYIGAGAYPDVSAPPTDSYRTIASAALSQLGKSNQMTNVAWVIQATPSSTLSGGTVTVTIPDLVLWLLGSSVANDLSGGGGASWTGLTPGTTYCLWVELAGSGPVFGSTPGTALPTTPPLSGGICYKVMVGGFNGTNDFSASSPYIQAIGPE